MSNDSSNDDWKIEIYLPFHQGGMYVFQIFDFYAASGMVLLCICFFESICIAYVYGVDKFYNDITKMVGFRLTPWFKYCWKYFTPIITMVGKLLRDEDRNDGIFSSIFYYRGS